MTKREEEKEEPAPGNNTDDYFHQADLQCLTEFAGNFRDRDAISKLMEAFSKNPPNKCNRDRRKVAGLKRAYEGHLRFLQRDRHSKDNPSLVSQSNDKFPDVRIHDSETKSNKKNDKSSR